MIKRLRAVFITVTMILVAVMLVSIFLVVLQSTYANLSRNNLEILQELDRESFRAPWPDFPEPLPKNCFILTVHVDGSIQITAGYDAVPSPHLQRQILEQARKTNERTGILRDFHLKFYQLDDPENMSYAFLDVTNENNTLRALIWNCSIIGVITLLLCFPICWMLARAITKPVAESITHQRQFLADASHELKTPLTVILTNAELLQSNDFTEVEKLRFADTIHDVAQQMRGLVEDMLHLARMEHASKIEYTSQVSLSDLAEECGMLYDTVYFESGRELHCVVDPDLWIWGNESRLRQMIDTLLDNGNKYSSPGSRVTLRLDRQHGNHCLLQISSRGKTLTPQECKDIFKRFYRVDAARTNSGSYGLGLPIAQQITREHRGKMWCVGKDGVNTFYAQFPLSNH